MVPASDVVQAVDARTVRTPGSHRARRRLRHVGRPRFRRPGRRAARRRSRRRTACSRSSATTTTTATCRRRCRASGSQCSRTSARGSTIRGETLELAGIRFWTRRAADIARVVSGARRDGAPARARSAAPDRSGGARMCRRCCPVTRTAVRSCCLASARSRGAVSGLAGPRSAGQHVDLREPRRRNGLRAGPDQLPAGSRAPDTAPTPDVTPCDEAASVNRQPPRARSARPPGRHGAPPREFAPPACRRCRRRGPARRAAGRSDRHRAPSSRDARSRR